MAPEGKAKGLFFGMVMRGGCWTCGERLSPNEVAGVCPACRWSWPLIDGRAGKVMVQERLGWDFVVAGVRVREGLGTEEVLHRMKYGGFPKVALSLGRWLAERHPSPPKQCVLVPVPIHWRRRWKRGFNQTEALAEGLAQSWGLEVRRDLLTRVRHGASLTGASREGRLAALRSTFVAHGHGLRVVLVDDVCTTGATASVCREALETSGHIVEGGAWVGLA